METVNYYKIKPTVQNLKEPFYRETFSNVVHKFDYRKKMDFYNINNTPMTFHYTGHSLRCFGDRKLKMFRLTNDEIRNLTDTLDFFKTYCECGKKYKRRQCQYTGEDTVFNTEDCKSDVLWKHHDMTCPIYVSQIMPKFIMEQILINHGLSRPFEFFYFKCLYLFDQYPGNYITLELYGHDAFHLPRGKIETYFDDPNNPRRFQFLPVQYPIDFEHFRSFRR